jgi:hypothetical protein
VLSVLVLNMMLSKRLAFICESDLERSRRHPTSGRPSLGSSPDYACSYPAKPSQPPMTVLQRKQCMFRGHWVRPWYTGTGFGCTTACGTHTCLWGKPRSCLSCGQWPGIPV